jgi:hypothetical protein
MFNVFKRKKHGKPIKPANEVDAVFLICLNQIDRADETRRSVMINRLADYVFSHLHELQPKILRDGKRELQGFNARISMWKTTRDDIECMPPCVGEE